MEREIKDFKQLTNDDLLTLYSAISDHINYLNRQILTVEEDNKEENGGDSDE